MKTNSLQTTSERVEKDRVKLRVEVPEETLKPAIDATYRRWANEIRVPGFRKGKVPRQLIEARVGGAEVIREEALRDALPDLYREALRAEDVEPIAAPEIEVLDFEQGMPLVFEATVDVRPAIEIPDLSAITIEAPSPDITESNVDEQLQNLRERFAEVETVGREARRGDFALIDLRGYRHDELVEGASAPDLLYEIGSRSGPPKLDEELEGNRAGAILKFTDTMPEGAGELAGADVSFTVLLKEVKAKRLPEPNDDFAKTVGFDTLDELKEDLRTRLRDVKRQIVDDEIRQRALEAVVNRASFEVPEKLVDSEFSHRLEHLQEDLKRAGFTLERYAEETGSTELALRSDLRRQAAQSVAAELLLEEIAREQEIDVSEEEMGREVAMAAARAQRDPKEVAEQLVSSGRLGAVAADIMRRKALDHVVDHIEVVGRPADEEDAEDGPE